MPQPRSYHPAHRSRRLTSPRPPISAWKWVPLRHGFGSRPRTQCGSGRPGPAELRGTTVSASHVSQRFAEALHPTTSREPRPKATSELSCVKVTNTSQSQPAESHVPHSSASCLHSPGPTWPVTGAHSDYSRMGECAHETVPRSPSAASAYLANAGRPGQRKRPGRRTPSRSRAEGVPVLETPT